MAWLHKDTHNNSDEWGLIVMIKDSEVPSFLKLVNNNEGDEGAQEDEKKD